MVDPRSFISSLKAQPWYSGQIVAVKELPAKEAEYAEEARLLKTPFPEPLERYLSARGIRLYSHQVEALERIRAGENVVITTPTASGKTLAFNLPIFERLHRDKKATALYLYPLKALTNDQLRAIRELEEATGLALEAAVYDGDTPQHLRPKIRERSRVVLTNPYALHEYLPWHYKWQRFFQNLKFVVIDEGHRYRGVFGSNVALLIRRLRRILSYYGSEPQFILSSATIANPEEFAFKLTGKEFTVVSRDGSAHGPRYFIFWNPLKYPARSAHRQTSDLLALHVESGLQTLCFTISRALAELVARWAKEAAPERRIASYRAGYLPEERREIERGLKERELDGVAATNALELGVDIGGLDAVIISGYPGTVISTWQQAGRAGRGREPALVTLVGFENPLDQYFMNHPEEFFSRPHEHAIIDLENEHILMGHLLCAAAELPLGRSELKLLGANEDHLKPLEGKFLQKSSVGWIYRGTVRPVDLVNLDSISERTVQVLCDGELLETMEFNRALEEAHPGAVLLHQGETYLIKELDLEKDVALAAKEEVDYYTDALKISEVSLLRAHRTQEVSGLELGLGELRVTERVIGYRVRRYERTVGIKDLQLPAVEFETTGLWLALPDSLRGEVERAGRGWPGGLHGAEHALIAMAPFYAMCDRWDIGGVSTPFDPDLKGPGIFIYDGFPGGIGITEKLYELLLEWVEATYRLVRDCPCAEGCPSCIYSPKCGNQNRPLDKEAAVAILAAIREALSASA
ncbi:MAG: DEAD/DEAH box helicase [Candidatus Acetothermia bacterium]|jgi:DEAD/DEAH box helicase domain-containing protein|nr:DEAD/DEAH box helicase [Candidatus Acetothermia bacterium]MDH7505950.1 DEAD/DEAH box helicase [Candidatus Acetothermia bacterium]